MRNVIAIVVVTWVAVACVTDDKGNTCNFLSSYPDGDVTYCPDEAAPDDCEELKDSVVDSLVDCGLEENDAQSTADDALPCDKAVATTKDFDACLDALDGDCITELPKSCEGAIIVDANK